MLIAQIMPMMQTYILPYGQYGYKGHVICLPQDVQSAATALPRTGRSVGVVVIKRKSKSGGHRDFSVRRAVVLEAFRWLIRNNRYYSNVTIDYDVVDALPEDCTLSDLQVIEDDDLAKLNPNDDANVDEQSQQEVSSDDENLPLQQTVLLPLDAGKCENDIIRDSVNEGARTCSPRVAHAQLFVSDQIVNND